ncbi:MAG: M12 family metallo-peptidase [Chitinophagaceae bacterium]|nr:M12 family metallo-peptidase [Chitinophagaceae bacterium]
MKSTLRHLLAAVILTGTAFQSFSQEMWSTAASSGIDPLFRSGPASFPAEGQFDLLQLNVTELKRRIGSARQSVGAAGKLASRFELDLPVIGGGFIKAIAEESSILTPALSQLLPDLKTYVVYDAASKSSLGRVTIHANGITALLFTPDGTQYLHPLGNNGNTHATYLTRTLQLPVEVKCALQTDELSLDMGRGGTAARGNAGDGRLRTYRLAVAATGEYVQWAGNSQTAALAAIAICVNSVNAIYERDAAIRFTLVSSTDLLFTDPLTDPYGTALDGTLLSANDNMMDLVLGSANYDVGVVFSYDWNGGLAQLNSVCTANKGRSGAGLTFGVGANPTPGPQGPVFDGTVAHEIAHQFGATHTMAANNGGCNGNTTPASAWEPGGGSTIMAYAGVCSGNSFQNNADLYFHAGNVAQIANYAVNLAGNTCPVLGAPNNTLPDVTVAATAYTIPVSTPFFLNAIGTDADGNTLTYTWEQMDAGPVTGLSPQATSASGPNFRSYPPSEKSIRYFPNLASVVSATATPYEVLPSVSRIMNFRVNVRDNAISGGGNVYEDVVVTTDATGGPFSVTSQNTPVSLTANGSNSMTITWNVAGTTAAPFNTSLVDIYFSADGGANFNYPLLMGTANDGSEDIPVPNIPTASGRIMIRAVGNIFFNVNAANISIASSCAAEGASLTPETNVTSTPGSAALNLAVAPNFGTNLFPTVGASLTSGDPSSTLAVYNSGTGGCINFSNEFIYDVYPFQVNVSGNYTFQKNAGTFIMNVYQENSLLIIHVLLLLDQMAFLMAPLFQFQIRSQFRWLQVCAIHSQWALSTPPLLPCLSIILFH